MQTLPYFHTLMMETDSRGRGEGSVGDDTAAGAEDHFTYEEPNQAAKCLAEISQLWYSKQYCDVNLLIQDAEGQPILAITAHRLVLAASIPYFRAMFKSDMQEAAQRDVTLHGCVASAVKSLVEFVYTGTVEVNVSNAQDLLVTANMFELPSIVDCCAKFIAKHISPANCLGIRDFAVIHSLEVLQKTATLYSYEHFSKVSRQDEFVSLSLSQVIALIRRDDIRVDSEEDVYESVTRWINHDIETRADHSDMLYNHVRFPIMSLKFLKDIASNNPLLQSRKGTEYLQKAFEYYKNPGVVIFADPKKTQPRSCVQGIICVIGGVGDTGDALNDTCLYNPHEKEWKPGPKMCQHRSRHAAAFLNGELYAIGGADLGESLSQCEKYTPSENCWKPISSLITPRRSCAVVVVNSRLFALGGHSGSVFLQSVEVYDPQTNEWVQGPHMLEARSELCSVFLDQRIYAIGGRNSSGHLRSVERYDLLNKRWEKIPSMGAPRSGAGEWEREVEGGGERERARRGNISASS